MIIFNRLLSQKKTNAYCLMLSFLVFFYSHVFKLFAQEVFGSRILYCNLVLYTRIWVWYGNRKKEKLEDVCPDENLTFTNSFSFSCEKLNLFNFIFSKATDDSTAGRTFVVINLGTLSDAVSSRTVIFWYSNFVICFKRP